MHASDISIPARGPHREYFKRSVSDMAADSISNMPKPLVTYEVAHAVIDAALDAVLNDIDLHKEMMAEAKIA